MPALALLGVLALVWDIWIAGYLAQLRESPRILAALSGLVALLVAPAVVLAVAGAGAGGPEAGTLGGVAWIWPTTLALCTGHALYVAAKRIAPPLVAIPILVYDLLLTGVAIVRYAGEVGEAPPLWALTAGAAYVGSLGQLVGRAALASPYALLVPLVAPAIRARGRAMRGLGAVAALVAGGWIAVTLVSLPRAYRAVMSYGALAPPALPDRAPDGLAVGLQLLPPVVGFPPADALRNDLALADSVQAEVVGITIDPAGVRPPVLDSVARALETLRRDSTALVVALGAGAFGGDARAASPRAVDAARVMAVTRVSQRLRPDYLLPGGESRSPNSSRGIAGPVRAEIAYLTASAAAAHAVDPHIRVALSLSDFSERDSALFEWGANPASPIDAVGFVLYPGLDGALSLDANQRIAERWMRRFPYREYWVFAVGGYPIAHGEINQLRAIWGTLAWAAAQREIRGVLVAQGGDYGSRTGLRTPTGRLRAAVAAVARAARATRTDTTAAP